MKIQIIGAGAMGLVLAHFLSSKNEVILVVKKGTSERYKDVKVLIDGHYYRLNVKISEKLDEADLTLVAVKSYDLPNISDVKIAGDVMFIQNGLTHLRYKIGKRNFYCVTTWAARKIDEETSELTGRGYFRVGSEDGFLDLSFLRDTGINAEWVDDIKMELFRKAGINAVINPITAIYRIPNGAIIENQYINFISKKVSEEIQMLYNKMGLKINVWEDVEYTANVTRRNYSSMLQDILKGSRTEIESITGELLKYANSNKIEMQLNELLYNTLKNLEFQKS